jgi:hypothetical protein
LLRFAEGRYYVVRANALEDNFRLYAYDRGRRQLASARGGGERPAFLFFQRRPAAAAGCWAAGTRPDVSRTHEAESLFLAASVQNSSAARPLPERMLRRDLDKSDRNRGDRDSSRPSRSSSSIGASSIATALPLRVMTTGPPDSTSSKKALSLALTSARLAIFMTQAPFRQ